MRKLDSTVLSIVQKTLGTSKFVKNSDDCYLTTFGGFNKFSINEVNKKIVTVLENIYGDYFEYNEDESSVDYNSGYPTAGMANIQFLPREDALDEVDGDDNIAVTVTLVENNDAGIACAMVTTFDSREDL